MSSTRDWRAGDKGRDLEGSGFQSAVEEVWRGSNFSPGSAEVREGKARSVGSLWSVVEDILRVVVKDRVKILWEG